MVCSDLFQFTFFYLIFSAYIPLGHVEHDLNLHLPAIEIFLFSTTYMLLKIVFIISNFPFFNSKYSDQNGGAINLSLDVPIAIGTNSSLQHNFVNTKNSIRWNFSPQQSKKPNYRKTDYLVPEYTLIKSR